MAGIHAFSKAFGHDSTAKLIIKVNGSSLELQEEVERLSLRNVEIVERFLDDISMLELFQSASVLLSLHRAEGFGIPILEAMSLGVPVIATNWSGNIDFMNEQNSILVPSKQVPVNDNKLYSRYSNLTWADPDVEEAARALQLLQTDNEFCKRLADQGRKTANRLLRSWQFPGARSCIDASLIAEA